MTEISSPTHIAFILDGNRRWAKEHKLRSLLGHKKGFEQAKSLLSLFVERNIKYITYFVFSLENWNRSANEVSYLMDLFRDFFEGSIDYFNEIGARVLAIGNLRKLPEDLQEKLAAIQEATKGNSILTLVLAISYSGRDEILRATKKIASDILESAIKSFSEDPRATFSTKKSFALLNSIDESAFAANLDTVGIPDPDILVRTSEKRISNFMLWQCAYSELFFLDKYWPDFCETDLDLILDEFQRRNRRYGR